MNIKDVILFHLLDHDVSDAKFVAMDADGEVFGFMTKPKYTDSGLGIWRDAEVSKQMGYFMIDLSKFKIDPYTVIETCIDLTHDDD